MAKRFIDTNFYRSPFVRALKPHLKAFYLYMICDCSHAGIWIKDFEAVKMYTGADVSEQEFQDEFIATGKAILLKPGFYFFPDFIEHQYPSGLAENNKAHKGIIHELRKNKIDFQELKPLESPLEGSKEMDMDKDMDKDKIGKIENSNVKGIYYIKVDPTIESESCKNDQGFVENIRRRISCDEATALNWIDSFRSEVIATKEQHNNVNDFRRHCTNWIAAQIKKSVKPNQNEKKAAPSARVI